MVRGIVPTGILRGIAPIGDGVASIAGMILGSMEVIMDIMAVTTVDTMAIMADITVVTTADITADTILMNITRTTEIKADGQQQHHTMVVAAAARIMLPHRELTDVVQRQPAVPQQPDVVHR